MGFQCRWLVVKCDHIRRPSIAYVMSLFEWKSRHVIFVVLLISMWTFHCDGFLIKSTKMARIQIFSQKSIKFAKFMYHFLI